MIETESLRKLYKSDGQTVAAVDGVSLRIEDGEFLAIAGPSGSGKTTFLNMIGGLDRPTEGRILLDGVRVDALGQAAMTRLRREKLGFIFQSYNLIPVLTARENVELGLELRGDGAAGETAGDLLARVGLKGLEERRPGQLSGGQQQRVAAARALAGKPRLVVADEPTANLDSHSAESLLELFQELNRASGVTFLFSSHDPRVLSRARRVVTFRDGRVDSDSAR